MTLGALVLIAVCSAEPAEAPALGSSREPAAPLAARPLAVALEEAAPTAARTPPEREPNWRVPAAHAGGLLAGMRLALSALWPRAFDPLLFSENGARFRQSWSSPPELRRDRPLFESDRDPWTLNVVGHGLFGSELYLRARQCGHGRLAAFTGTALTSGLWEYGIEAFHKQPSAIDLAWTPLSGLVLGEARFWVFRLARERVPEGPLRRVLMGAFDPLGELERALGAGC